MLGIAEGELVVHITMLLYEIGVTCPDMLKQEDNKINILHFKPKQSGHKHILQRSTALL